MVKKLDNRIREIIKTLNKKGITVSEIITNSGVSRTQFYAILNEGSVPKLTTANAICKALKTDIKDVFPELKESEESVQAIN